MYQGHALNALTAGCPMDSLAMVLEAVLYLGQRPRWVVLSLISDKPANEVGVWHKESIWLKGKL